MLRPCFSLLRRRRQRAPDAAEVVSPARHQGGQLSQNRPGMPAMGAEQRATGKKGKERRLEGKGVRSRS